MPLIGSNSTIHLNQYHQLVAIKLMIYFVLFSINEIFRVFEMVFCFYLILFFNFKHSI